MYKDTILSQTTFGTVIDNTMDEFQLSYAKNLYIKDSTYFPLIATQTRAPI